MSFPLNQPAQHYRSDTSHKVFNTPSIGSRSAQFGPTANSRSGPTCPGSRAGDAESRSTSKRKSFVGDFRNGGTRLAAQPPTGTRGSTTSSNLGWDKCQSSYGIYRRFQTTNRSVSVGDTARRCPALVAANTISRWRHQMRQHRIRRRHNRLCDHRLCRRLQPKPHPSMDPCLAALRGHRNRSVAQLSRRPQWGQAPRNGTRSNAGRSRLHQSRLARPAPQTPATNHRGKSPVSEPADHHPSMTHQSKSDHDSDRRGGNVRQGPVGARPRLRSPSASDTTVARVLTGDW